MPKVSVSAIPGAAGVGLSAAIGIAGGIYASPPWLAEVTIAGSVVLGAINALGLRTAVRTDRRLIHTECPSWDRELDEQTMIGASKQALSG